MRLTFCFLALTLIAANASAALTSTEEACRGPSASAALPQILKDALAENCDQAAAYHAARILILRGQESAALPWLRQLQAIGWKLGIDAAPKGVAQTAVNALNEVMSTSANSRIHTQINEHGVFPEGIGYDPRQKRIFLGSLHQGRLLVAEENGAISSWPLPDPAAAYATYGLHFNAEANQLLLLRNPKSVDGGLESQMLVLDGGTGKHIKTLSRAIPQTSEFNSICISKNQMMYVTDSLQHQLLSASAHAPELVPIETDADIRFPNGIACMPSGHIIISDWRGLVRYEPTTGLGTRLVAPGDETLGGIDGLTLSPSGHLIGVQNAFRSQRIVSIQLSDNYTGIRSIEVLEENHPHFAIPTTGVMVGSEFVYIANSQLDLLDRFRQSPDIEGVQLQPIKLLRLVTSRH